MKNRFTIGSNLCATFYATAFEVRLHYSDPMSTAGQWKRKAECPFCPGILRQQSCAPLFSIQNQPEAKLIEGKLRMDQPMENVLVLKTSTRFHWRGRPVARDAKQHL